MIIGAENWDGKFDPDTDTALTSMSSLDNVSAKHQLENWKRGNMADFTIENVDVLAQWLAEYGPDQLRKILMGAQYPAVPDGMLQQNQIGTVTHAWAEGKAGTFAWPSDIPETPEAWAQVKPFMTHVDRFFDEWVADIVAVEEAVFDPGAGVAGRFDAKLRLKPAYDETVLVDFKSADRPKQVYGQSHALQLAGYRYAPLQATFKPRTMSSDGNRYYLLNEAEIEACVEPDPVFATCVVQITPESYEVWPIRTDTQVHAFVRSYANMHRWVAGVSDTVVGKPLS